MKNGKRGYATWHRMTDGYDRVNAHNKILLGEFLSYKSRRLSPQTITAYKYWAKCFFVWNMRSNGDKNFEEVRISEFSAYFDWLSSLGLSPARLATLKAVLSSMSDVLELLHEDDWPIFRNKVRRIDLPIRHNTVKKTVITAEILGRMLNILLRKDKEAACYLALLASCGCRRGEAAQMKAEWFNADHEAFDGVVYETEDVRAKGRGAGGKRIRKYVVKNSFEPYLKAWLCEKQMHAQDEFLFVKHTSAYMGELAKRISKICDIDFYSHCMRHYFCGELKNKNVPDDAIKDVFSWESSAMVKIYDDAKPIEKVKRAFLRLIE